MTDTTAKVHQILMESLCITQEQIDNAGAKPIFVNHGDLLPGENGPDSLGGDSLDWVEVIMSCEERFDIEIGDEDAADPAHNSVDGLVAYIERRRAENP